MGLSLFFFSLICCRWSQTLAKCICRGCFFCSSEKDADFFPFYYVNALIDIVLSQTNAGYGAVKCQNLALTHIYLAMGKPFSRPLFANTWKKCCHLCMPDLQLSPHFHNIIIYKRSCKITTTLASVLGCINFCENSCTYRQLPEESRMTIKLTKNSTTILYKAFENKRLLPLFNVKCTV